MKAKTAIDHSQANLEALLEFQITKDSSQPQESDKLEHAEQLQLQILLGFILLRHRCFLLLHLYEEHVELLERNR